LAVHSSSGAPARLLRLRQPHDAGIRVHVIPYEIINPVGTGGMGAVYKARDTRLDRLVAINVSDARGLSEPNLKL
jgi:serine/threonine protein kinase